MIRIVTSALPGKERVMFVINEDGITMGAFEAPPNVPDGDYTEEELGELLEEE